MIFLQQEKYKKIGMRNIKTAVSVMLCLALNQLFCYIYTIIAFDNIFVDIFAFVFVRDYPIYACVAAVITMQSTVQDSVKKGVSRVIGTLMGGAFGLLFLAICNALAWPILDIFFATIGVVLCIHFCNAFGHSDSGPISCVVLLIILITATESDPLFYALDRVIDTIGGIIITVFVNRFLLTPSFIWRIHQRKNETVDFISVQELT